MKTIKELYTYSSANNIKLLSEYSSSFWSDYKSNYQRYDNIFERLFVSSSLRKYSNELNNLSNILSYL